LPLESKTLDESLWKIWLPSYQLRDCVLADRMLLLCPQFLRREGIAKDLEFWRWQDEDWQHLEVPKITGNCEQINTKLPVAVKVIWFALLCFSRQSASCFPTSNKVSARAID
jgi:hypothetical protein